MRGRVAPTGGGCDQSGEQHARALFHLTDTGRSLTTDVKSPENNRVSARRGRQQLDCDRSGGYRVTVDVERC